MTTRPLALYIHLPFCLRKCHYCDFNSRPAPPDERAEYLAAVRQEIAARAHDLADGARLDTIYLGGGTPTVYGADDLAGLLDLVTEAFHVSPTAEISIEANPETLDARKLRRLRAAGFSRLSIGAQSFDDAQLRMLGRGHRAADSARAVAMARQAGFRHLSLDLIYALPGQTQRSWERTLALALRLQPEHLSAYGLSIEEGTPLAGRVQRGELAPVGEDEHLAMRRLTGAMCAKAGLRRYEISNYALPGRHCRHNMVYWHNGEYVGVGAGAVSYLDRARAANVRDSAAYTRACLAGEPSLETGERLGPDGQLAETVMLGLRLAEGLAVAELVARFGDEPVAALGERARPLIEAGLLRANGERVWLTAAGQALHSEVAARLM